LTVSNNTISGNWSGVGGGGIYIYADRADVTGNVISDNGTDMRGGGLRSSGLGMAPWQKSSISDNVITGNSAVEGGGISSNAIQLFIQGNTIAENAANRGGAIYCLHSVHTLVERNEVVYNHTLEHGGGIFTDECALIARDNEISFNDAMVEGGGIFCRSVFPQIIDNNICGNLAVRGAGIASIESTPLIKGNLIADNSHIESTTYTSGGGIFAWSSSPSIENNLVLRNSVDGSGGGIQCNECTPVISDNVVMDNVAAHCGGIYCLDSNATVVGNSVSQNVSYNGGGIGIDGSSAELRENLVSFNGALDSGGGIYCDLSEVDIADNLVSFNAAYYGGGLYLYRSTADIRDNTVHENTAGDPSSTSWGIGGGIYCRESSSVIDGNVIRGNSILGAGGARAHGPISTDVPEQGSGGGIYCRSCSPVLTNNLIALNSCLLFGGGFYFEDHSYPIVRNCTITQNSAPWGGGISGAPDTRAEIFDCIISYNGDDLRSCTATYSCIGDTEDAGEGNIHDHPLFTAGPLGDYYLDPDSPCIDAGSQSAYDAGLYRWRTTQADGTPDTGTVDMGFHYPMP